MDGKEHQLLNHYYDKIVIGNFDEKDIYTFLILIRSYSVKNSPVYEFSYFVAHREKDRGCIKEYIEKTKKEMSNLGKMKLTIVIKPVFSTDEVLR